MTPNAERVTFTKEKEDGCLSRALRLLADTHAHLLSFWGKDVPETLARAKAAGVDLLVTMFDPIADKRSVADYSDWLVREILPMQDIPQNEVSCRRASVWRAGLYRRRSCTGRCGT